MPCTMVYYSDRHPATVVRVVSKVTIDIQEDDAKRTDNNGMSESQTYEYKQNPNGVIHRARLTKRGWRAKGTGVILGHREMYYDFSF